MKVLILLGLAVAAWSQSTQGLIAGRVTESTTQAGLDGAEIEYENLHLNLRDRVRSNASGYYAIPLLPPGSYRLRVMAGQYQSQELRELELAVGAALNLNFALRPLADLWEKKSLTKTVFLPGRRSLMEYFGPDLGSTKLLMLDADRGRTSLLESGISNVIDPNQIQNLPLASRDVYATLVLQAGVTADSATARGLGISVNGQRVSSSNFLLDGAENNNSLTSGPLTPVAPEAVQEYRISTNNFSAEFGRTSGFLANAVTRSGGKAWHGLGYFYGKNEILNAADFQQNLSGNPRTPIRESQPGFSVGGPLVGQRLFVAGSYEFFRFRSRLDPQLVALPTSSFLNYCAQQQLSCAEPGSPARNLLTNPLFAPPRIEDPLNPVANLMIAPTATVNRMLATPRLDYVSPKGKARWMARYAFAGAKQPDAGWTPYKEFQTPLNQSTSAFVLGATNTLRPILTHEARLSWSRVEIRFDQAHPEIPILDASNASIGGVGLVLPGTRNYYSLMDRNRLWQLSDNWILTEGRNQLKVGGGVFLRNLDNYLKVNQSGYYFFNSLRDFADDKPGAREFAIARREYGNAFTTESKFVSPKSDRSYNSWDLFWFLQDSLRVNRKLNLNLGIRMDRFGDPHNTGAVKDGLLTLDSNQPMAAQIKAAKVDFSAQGDQRIYRSIQNNFAVRAGFAFQPFENRKLVIRGGYGIFYDRPYDNLWSNVRNNDVLIARQLLPPGRGIGQPVAASTNYLEPLAKSLATLTVVDSLQSIINVTALPSQMEQGAVHSGFVGMQQGLGGAWSWEWNGQFSAGRNLATTDQLNRNFSEMFVSSNPSGVWNRNLGRISYRNSQGKSQFRATTVALRRHGRNFTLHLGYSLGLAQDNQSEPLIGEFNFAERSSGGSGLGGLTSFTRQLDWGSDYGRSDFNQKHNLVFYSIWKIPGPASASGWRRVASNWTLAHLGAFRSGRPFSVFYGSAFTTTSALLFKNRANRCGDVAAEIRSPIPGGQKLLNAVAFCQAAAGLIGDTGRNAFTGPGIYNFDVSLGRTLVLREGYRMVLRADAFNVLNHANLGNPDSSAGSTFGYASYGRQERGSGFPLQTPLRETARQIQFLLRLEF